MGRNRQRDGNRATLGDEAIYRKCHRVACYYMIREAMEHPAKGYVCA